MNVALVYRGRYHIREALDLETLAPVIRAGGHRVRFVYDADTFGVTDNVLQIPPLARRLSSPQQVVRRIAAGGPDALVFSVLTSTYAWARQVAEALKQRTAAPVVFLGLHPSLAAERVARDEFVDYTIQGEAEGVIDPLLECIDRGEEPSGVGNLWYRHNGEAVFTGRAPLVDLDALPLPDKDLFRPYVSHSYSYSCMVSRGCPYACTFCEETCSKKLYGAAYFRRKSVESVLQELIAAKRKYHYREVIFKDSYLSGNTKWLAALMRGYRRHVGVPFKCFCTVLGFDAETARLLKEGGCYSIEFGLQTWNDRIRREVLNRRETNEQALRVFGHCADQRLWYDVDHMFNLPTETEQDHIDGARIYRRLRYLSRIKVHYLMYVPTADIIDKGIEQGLLPSNVHERLADGLESDFYDQATGSQADRRTVASYAALYKLLPALPGRLVRWLLRGGRVGWLRRIPSPLMALLQGLIALRSGDLRFAAYLRFYPAKVAAAVAERLRSNGSDS